ncbi:MAG TPA: amino acid adenylation domain-containing protein, partial [Thermoanaerobaculia bacterium]|nr:amino acid adenylation domain-containing protein [Thermoanaerobaculia bacterium]
MTRESTEAVAASSPAGGGRAGAGSPRRDPAALVERLRRIAAQALALDPSRLDAERPLLALGVDSLAAAEIAGAIEAELGVRVSLAGLIEGASLAGLAGEIARELAGRDAGRTMAGELAAGGAEPPGRHAVSQGQRALLLLDRLVLGGNPAYVMAGAARVLGGWDRDRFARALTGIVARHAALRTTFVAADGDFARQVHATGSWQLVEQDATGWREAALAGAMAEAAQRPFDLERGPLLRAAVFACTGGRRLLVLAVHHLVADFASVGVLLRDLAALYGRDGAPGRRAGLSPAAASYGAYVRAQEAELAGPEGERLRSYWHRELGGADGTGRELPVLSLPADRPRPPVPSFGGGTRRLRLSRELGERLQALGSAAGATRFMTLLAGFVALLHRHGGQPQVLVGTPASGRGRPERAGLVGYLVNPVVVRGDAAGDPTFTELLGRVRQSALGAFAHQEYPLARLAEELGGERDGSRSALFQAMFVLYRERGPGEAGLAALALGEAGARLALGGLALESVALPRRSAQFDLTLQMADLGPGLLGALQYNSDLFDGATAQRLAGHLSTLLAAVAAGARDGAGHGAQRRLGDLPLLAAGERQQLLEWNGTAAACGPPACLHELIAAQARRTPDAVAVEAAAAGSTEEDGGAWESLTYHELNARAERLAGVLRRLGVGPETVVAVCAERSAALMVGLLGILKAGGAYLPLDPGYPPERLRYMLRDSGAPVLLAQERLRAAVVSRLQAPPGGTVWLDGGAADGGAADGGEETDGAAAGGSAAGGSSAGGSGAAAGMADGLAYVIYTSGSTGRPKGTMNTHRGIVNRLLWMQERFGLGPDDRVLQKTPASFDVSVWELFWPLLAGARLVMAAPGGHRDAAYLLRTLAAREITTLHFVPAMLAAFLEHLATLPRPALPARLRSLRRVMASGEALPWDLQQRCHALLGAPLHNLYGPTEAAVDVTHWACDPASPRRLVPIGRPIANTAIHLLDRGGAQVPVGVPGELFIGGVQLARGYLGRPDLTAERFVPNPLAGAAGPAGSRLYRTGDVARHLPDGAIDYLGRTDDQVKIRGFRIELGEIEAVLLRCGEVRQAAVVAAPASNEFRDRRQSEARPPVAGRDAPGSPAAVGADAQAGAAGTPHPPPGAVGPADRRLVAYVVPETAAAAAGAGRDGSKAAAAGATGALAERLRRRLQESLPEHMLPASFVVLPALPLTASGKVDRRALPAPERAAGGAGDGARRTAPRTPAEQLLAGLWADVLPVGEPADPRAPRIAAEDSFFALGGHSLLAVRMLAELRRRTQVELPLARLFELPRLADLAHEVEARAPAAGSLPEPIRRLPRETLDLPVALAQERLWFLDRLHPGSAAYNLAGGLRFVGRLEPAAIAASLGEIRRRHQVLRTRFVALPAGGVAARLAPDAGGPAAPAEALAMIDLAGLPPRRRAAVAAGLAAAAARRPFDLALDPLLRALLVRLTTGGDGGDAASAGCAKTAERAASAKTAGTDESAESAASAKTAGSDESTESAESAKTAGSAESAESAESAKTAGSDESTKSAASA